MTCLNPAIEIMNIETREVISFTGGTECSKFFGVTPESIHHQIRTRKLSVPYRGYLIKKKEDPTPWPDRDDVAEIINKSGIFVTLTSIDTGIKTRYSSIRAAAKIIGVNSVYLHNKLKKDPNDPIKGYLARRGQ